MGSKTYYFLTFLVVFSLGYFFRLRTKLQFSFNSGDRVRIKTRLTQEPVIKNDKQIFKAQGIFISTAHFPEFHYGDYLVITGQVKKRTINSVFNQFWLINPEIEFASQSLSSERTILAKLFQFRSQLEQVFNQTLTEPQASLLIGILLGIQRSLPDNFYQALRITGTLHIVVASGMNISLTAGLLGDFLARFLSRKLALVIALIAIMVYCLLAGMSPAIVRAGLMAAVLYLAVFTGRKADGLLTLILVGAIMLLINPLLLFDAGFQLSFSATAGLISSTSFWKKIFDKIIPWLSSDLGETVSAQIFTLPILVITFGHFNPLAVIPNVFVLWLIPFLMILGLLIGFVGLLWLSLAQFLSWLSWLPLTYFVKIINFFGQFEFFNLKLEGLSWIFGLGYYLILISLIKFKTKKWN